MPIKKVVKKAIKKYSDLTPEGFLKPQVKLPKSFKKPKTRVGAAEDFIDKKIAKGKKEAKQKAFQLRRKASRIMGQAMKPEIRKDKKKQADSLKAQADKLLREAGFKEVKKAAGGVIKKITKKVTEGVKKRGRKSKRGRPKKKVEEVKKVTTKKKQDPFKVKKQKGESDKAFSKRKREITKLRKAQEKELSKERGTKKPTEKDRTEASRVIPPERKQMSRRGFQRRVKQGLIGVTKEGKTKNIGKYAEPPSDIMEKFGYTKGSSRGSGQEFTEQELKRKGFTIKKAGGPLKSIPAKNKGLSKLPTPVRNKMGFKKRGGKVQKRAGGGVALRGFGVTRKK